METARFRPYRAPSEHRGILVDPALSLERPQISTRFAPLARRARSELHRAAVQYTESYRCVANRHKQISDDTYFLLGGHQPELFHPGVWFKNFALSRLGQEPHVLPINLIIDHDICRAPTIRVPTEFMPNTWQATSIAFDGVQPAVPWEQRGIADPHTFAEFAHHVKQATEATTLYPLVEQLWPHVSVAAQATQNLGWSLARGRHVLEAKLGLETLEVPMSQVCDSSCFLQFILELSEQLPRLQMIYNEALQEYRTDHHIRSRSHPVPALESVEDWHEAPFWVYRSDAPQRRQLFIRRMTGGFEFSNRADWSLRIKTTPDLANAAQDLLNQLQQMKICIRPRALMTTMYARLVLSDLFIHGIGGGKYDQLTDLIMERFFSVPPPTYCVISATVKLPDAPSIQMAQARTQAYTRQLRQLDYQPERLAEASHLPERLVQEKQRLLYERPENGSRRAWHQRLTQVNQRMSAALEPVRRRLLDESLRAEQDLRQARLRGSREWSFCVYPLDYLQSELEMLAHALL